MTKSSRRLLIVLLAFVCAFAVFAFGVNTSAQATGKEIDEVTLVMEQGAEVRLERGNGMRFNGVISEDDYDALVEQYGEGNFSFGMFLMPKAYESKVGAINADNTFGASPKYIWGAGATDVKVDGKYRILHVEMLPTYDSEIGAYRLYGSVVKMKDANVGLDYVACAYVKAGSDVQFADTTSRSIVEVSLRAINSGAYDGVDKAEQKAVLQNYVTTYTNNYKEAHSGSEPTFSYTVNYVSPDPEVGLVGSTVVEDIAMNSSVAMQITAPTGYALNRSSIVKDSVYAKDVSIDVEVVSATSLSSESDIHNKYLKASDLNYSVEADIDCETATAISYNSWITANGILDGKGHVITNPVIDDDITSYGLATSQFGNGIGAEATIRDLAVVNLTNSYRNYIAYATNCGTIENCYFSGTCVWHDLFEYVYGGKVTLKNVILDCYNKNDGYPLGKAGENGASNAVYENVIQLDKNGKGAYSGSSYGDTLMTYEEFFTTYADGLPSSWDNTGFTVDGLGLKFHGKLLIANPSVPVTDLTDLSIGGTFGVLASICNDDTQYIELPVNIGGLGGGYTESVYVDWYGNGSWQAFDAVSYEVVNGKSKIGITTELANARITAQISGKGIYDCKVVGSDRIYTGKVQLLGNRHPLRVLSTADEFEELFTTEFFDNSAVYGGTQYDYYSFILDSDIDMTEKTISNDYTYYSVYAYTGTIDGRGHVVKNLTFNDNQYASYGGLIDFKATTGSEVKNIALVNMTTPRAFITNRADGLTIKNVYISGTSGWGEVFDEAHNTNGKVVVENVIFDASALYDSANYSANADVSNVINIAGNEDTFFENYGAGLGDEWANSGFAVTASGLTFNGTVVLAK